MGAHQAAAPSLRGAPCSTGQGEFSDVAILLLGLDSDLRVYASLKVHQDKRRWYKIAAAMKKRKNGLAMTAKEPKTAGAKINTSVGAAAQFISS
jgi:hypothetical protein